MRIKIENTGIIQRANVKLSGLNIIGGDNDTGKSTVGKLIFAIVKAVSRYEEDLDIKQSDFSSVLNILNSILPIMLKDAENLEGQDRKDAIKEATNLSHGFKNILNSLHEKITNNIALKDIEASLDKELTTIFNPIRIKVPEIDTKSLIQEIKKNIADLINEETKIFHALSKTLVSEFHGEISPKFQKKISEIEITKNDKTVLKFFIEKDKIKQLTAIEKLLFDDVTFIETPMIMQMSDLIRNAATILDLYDLDKSKRLDKFAKPKVALHTKDLMTKLENAHYYENLMLPKEPTQYMLLREKIATIINGSFIFDPQDKEFAFAKKTGKKNQSTIKAVNTASGVKSFGLIQMLLQTGILDHRSLVVIDEPETHLHPKWQLEYAKILIELVKNDISVLVASHSPYFIQALKVFSEREGIKDKTNFYLSEKNEKTGFATINEVTKDLNKLFATLAAPLKELL